MEPSWFGWRCLFLRRGCWNPSASRAAPPGTRWIFERGPRRCLAGTRAAGEVRLGPLVAGGAAGAGGMSTTSRKERTEDSLSELSQRSTEDTRSPERVARLSAEASLGASMAGRRAEGS